ASRMAPASLRRLLTVGPLVGLRLPGLLLPLQPLPGTLRGGLLVVVQVDFVRHVPSLIPSSAALPGTPRGPAAQRSPGRDSRMRREKSGPSPAARAASLIRERRRSSSKGNDVSNQPPSYR